MMEEKQNFATHVVVLIRSDPKKSHRPGEAMRIALGLASGRHRVEIILLGNSPLLLTSEIEDLVDGEMTEKYLVTLQEYVETFFFESETSVDLSACNYAAIPLNQSQISEKMATADRFLVF